MTTRYEYSVTLLSHERKRRPRQPTLSGRICAREALVSVLLTLHPAHVLAVVRRHQEVDERVHHLLSERLGVLAPLTLGHHLEHDHLDSDPLLQLLKAALAALALPPFGVEDVEREHARLVRPEFALVVDVAMTDLETKPF